MSGAAATVEDDAWWWDALRNGDLRIPCCASCGARWFPATPRCPACGSSTVTSVPAPATATLYSYVITHRDFGAGQPLPYTVAVADFGDSIKMFGAFVGDTARLACGMTVVPVVLETAAGGPVLAFHAAAPVSRKDASEIGRDV
jgi:uncharacterized OB-fold protein